MVLSNSVFVIAQEIGRVILNLINNAFYAVDEKKKTASDGYEPTVIVSTRKEKDKIEVKVKDNGNGIPQKVLDKIFQPFFTTKPTGQGTGLGLSLAYDIVKAHGGEIKVDTKEKDGSEFITTSSYLTVNKVTSHLISLTWIKTSSQPLKRTLLPTDLSQLDFFINDPAIMIRKQTKVCHVVRMVFFISR